MRRDGGAGRGIGGGPWADDELGLTDDQLSAIRLILEKYRPQMEAIRDQVRNGTLTRDEARAQTATIRDDIRTEIEALLTPEQVETMNRRWQDLEDRRGDREQRREQAQAAMADALGLTAEQQTQIDALRDSAKRVSAPAPAVDRARVEVSSASSAVATDRRPTPGWGRRFEAVGSIHR
jgi:Spy/CpxP family protein refolding chaperone